MTDETPKITVSPLAESDFPKITIDPESGRFLVHTSSATANADIRLIASVVENKDRSKALQEARAKLVGMTDHELDVFEATILEQPQAPTGFDQKITAVQFDALLKQERAARASKTGRNDLWIDRAITVATGLVTILVVVLTA